MFRLQVTIIRQTFQHMDVTCSGPQYGIPYCSHLLLQHKGIAPIKKGFSRLSFL